MNYLIVKSIIGRVLYFEAAFMLLPCFTALIYQEYSGWPFVFTALLCVLVGAVLTRKKTKNTVFYVKEGFVSVALSWIVLSFMGGLPFLFSGVISNPIDALFETVSGFTTTGASILKDVEVLPHCMLMWRSFTHWIGGMGVLVFLLTFMEMHGGSHMNLMKAESPGPSVSKLRPTVRSTAKILYIIYIVLTIVEILLLLAGGMPLFDSLTTSFGTAGTGGFGIKNDSIGGYSPYIQIVTVFMILFGVNFNAYFLIWCRKFTQAFRMEEVRCYFGIIFASIAVITLNIAHLYSGVGEALRHAAFQVGSIITTTGYATTDFNLWPQASRTILVLLMFIGACAGSTGGGIKVSRFIILIKTIKKELHTLLHPRSVRKLKLDGHTLEHEVVRSTNVFLIAYVLVFALSILLISFDGLDMVTNFTGVSAALNNIGPGLELVGPTQNFSIFSNGAKLVLTFDMLAGRLELFPMLLLFVRETWKKY
jgi:trk system potassium uptake protein TrkH